ncbi:hypothetical protein JX266_004764 [Neoarthrinium moseri]|nr:hypothetical protein JX266_004764 [Neoarthrinium moseri]
MDPITAVGFAAGILNFIEFSSTLVRGTLEVYHSTSGTTTDNTHSGKLLADLQEVTQELEVRFDVESGDQTAKALATLATKCMELSNELAAILQKLEARGRNKRWKSFQVAFFGVVKQNSIASIEKRLAEYRSQIILRLSLMTSSQNSALGHHFDDLAKTSLVLKRELGHNARLLKQLQASVQQMQSDGEISSILIKSQISELQKATLNTQQENLLLKGLYFDSLFLREESVSDPEAGTFRWLLDYGVQLSGHSSDTSYASTSPSSQEKINILDEAALSARLSAISAFRGFLEAGNGFFFICGKAGSGKSTLMKHLAYDRTLKQELDQWSGGRRLVVAKFFFWNSADAMQKSLKGLYQSLLFEVFRQCPDLIRVLSEVIPSAWSTGWKPKLDEMKTIFETLVSRSLPNVALCLIVDGLDEYEGDALEHFELAKLLKQWSSQPKVKIICSARPHTQFLDTFDLPHRVFHLHELTRNDIRSYVKVQFASRLPNTKNGDLMGAFGTIAEEIVGMSDGVFLWARLVVRSLLIGMAHDDSPKALMKRLNDTPRDINTLFRRILDSVDPSVRHRSDQMLSLALDNPFKHDLSAIVYSWIEDLDDPDFPFNRPCKGIGEAEVEKRLSIVRRQLDALTRGLLEIKEQRSGFGRWDGEAPYWRYPVGFLHKSVRDFLRDHWKINTLYGAAPTFDHLRLYIAQAQYGIGTHLCGSYIPYSVIRPQYGQIISFLAHISSHDDQRRILDHLARIHEGYRSLSLSYPKGENLLFWRETVECHTCRTHWLQPSVDVNFWHWITQTQFSWYSLELLRRHDRDNTSSRFIDRKRLSLSAICRPGNLDLLRYLFSTGVSPATLCTIIVYEDRKSNAFGSEGAVHAEAPLWLVFLRYYLLEWRSRPANMDRLLTCFLEAGADTNLIALAYIEKAPGRDKSFPVSILDGTLSFFIELKELLDIVGFCDDPARRDLLRGAYKVAWTAWMRPAVKLLNPYKSHGHAGSGWKDKYRPATQEELRDPGLTVFGVISETAGLVGRFKFPVLGVDEIDGPIEFHNKFRTGTVHRT